MPTIPAFRPDRPHGRRTRAVLAGLALAGLTATTGVTDSAVSANAPSCLVKGARLVAADGNVRIIRIAEKRKANETRRERFQACWTRTGKRFTLIIERDLVADIALTRSRFEIIGGRFVGRVTNFVGRGRERSTAATYDTMTRRKLHDTKTCDNVERGRTTGPDDVVFVAEGGGLAFSCGRLVFTDRNGEHELEPAGTDVRALATSDASLNANPRLYWVIRATDGSEQLRSQKLSPASLLE